MLADDKALVLAQNPVRSSEYSEPQPDLALLRPRGDFYREHHPRADDVLLIIEVAATSLSSDREPRTLHRGRSAAVSVQFSKLKMSSDVSGLVMPCSKYRSQIAAQGRPYMSGISYSMTAPGVSGVFRPSTEKMVCTHSMNA